MFDVFLYGSLLRLAAEWSNLAATASRGQFCGGPLSRSPGHTLFLRGQVAEFSLQHQNSLRGSRRHLAIRQHGGQTAAPLYPTGKSHRPNRKNLQARRDQLGTRVVHEGLFNLNSIISASPSL